MNVGVIGLGYVGLSTAIVFSNKYPVIGIEINKVRLETLVKGDFPFTDKSIKEGINLPELQIKFSSEYKDIHVCDFVFICVPTDLSEKDKKFNLSILDSCISKVLEINSKALIIIKSTIPVGYTDFLIHKYKYKNIIYAPEFLREGKALYDSLHPSRVIIGGNKEECLKLKVILEEIITKDINIMLVSTKEAESIKLFSNAYLAMRIAFFNELDMFAKTNNISSKKIIEGVSLDKRINNIYNQPSFGYGGYCLPKDTVELDTEFKLNKLNNPLISSIIESNNARKQYICNEIISIRPKVIGIYRLLSKKNGDNFRCSPTIDILNLLKSYEFSVIIYEPLIAEKNYLNCPIVNDLKEFAERCELIIADRIDDEIIIYKEKVYTKDSNFEVIKI